MEKYCYRLTTLSSLIVSPRGNLAWYEKSKRNRQNEEIEGFSTQEIKGGEYLDREKLKIIYPFYQYGEYRAYAPDSAEYYLPGSAVKGAFGGSSSGRCMVDDILVCRESIVLRNLYKAQYLFHETKKACLRVFMENVGVEMIKVETELKGELYLEDKAPEEFLEPGKRSTKTKLRQMLGYLQKLQKEYGDQPMGEEFRKMIDKLSSLFNDNNVVLIGGYKGLLHSIERTSASEAEGDREKTEGAVYLDQETGLPHGLVKVEWI
ncbi:hypothetical protein REC12_00400 [Desulfosporosinus sp. PR]|uniref:hypothetical protein n=1 Tax=Candidatus Desulfosporosinus nitrosoreducens TaxID=3401928 RepID=UPI0027F212FF|nr:hypothetical protein [Desulfosporosinus sp. PR]MDQ7092055.1 hypothetical protein [Desulfosporosinus sp. PR]